MGWGWLSVGNPETLEQGQNCSLGLTLGPSVDPEDAGKKADTVTGACFHSRKPEFLVLKAHIEGWGWSEEKMNFLREGR